MLLTRLIQFQWNSAAAFFLVFFLELIGPTTLRNIYERSRTEWELDNDSAIRLDGIRFRTDRLLSHSTLLQIETQLTQIKCQR